MQDIDPHPGAGLRGSNQSGLRAHNEKLVLSLVRRIGPLAKAQIARMTGLSAQTVSVIMRGLEEDGLLEKQAPMRGRVGQPSVPMGLAADGAYFLGLKVGRRSADMVLTDFLGNVRGRARRVHVFPEPDDVLAFARRSLVELVEGLAPDARRRIAGLGIAIPFSLWDWAGSIGVPPERMTSWRRADLAADLGVLVDFPVYQQNDATAACGAELVFGKGQAPRDFLYVYIGFFAGGGLVLNGSLYTGPTGNAAALGSMPVPASGGGSRQLIEIASLARLEVLVRARGGDPESLWGPPEDWRVPRAAVEDWLAPAGEALAYAVAAAGAMVEIETVVVDGWIPAAVRAALVAQVRETLAEIDLSGIRVPDIREGTVGPDARALGAASLPLSERFMID